MEPARSVAEARQIQERLRERLVFRPPRGFKPRVVAGADVAFDKARNLAFAAVVLIELDSLETVETATAALPISFPYVPGYLSFRELPALAAAWESLRERPDVAVLDAHGYAHPRRMGLACHAGLAFGLPAVGCAKSILCGEVGGLAEERGARAPLVDPKSGEQLGWALRTRDRVRPVYLSVGHLIDLPTAGELILRLTPGGRYRFPETTRRADRLAAEFKSGG
ncbi:MAG: endonuclease V [Gemmatimonadetes bacterium]|nr:endonuclease V [Gemmatimonadota bacterium]NIO32146.1 endonuclease V [Gemmatimonadota bacterium]